MLLIFSCGSYLRYKDICVITDSAYGVLEGMALMRLQGISWITSLRISQRQGFLGIKEIQKAGKEKRDADKKKEKKSNKDKKKEKKDADKKNKKMEDENKRSMKKDVAAWEKKHEKTRKGTSWMWKATLDIMKNVSSVIYLTAIQDSKICWRMDNFLESEKITGMHFQDYEPSSAVSNVKAKKQIFVPDVPKVHQIFRKFMGHARQMSNLKLWDSPG